MLEGSLTKDEWARMLYVFQETGYLKSGGNLSND